MDENKEGPLLWPDGEIEDGLVTICIGGMLLFKLHGIHCSDLGVLAAFAIRCRRNRRSGDGFYIYTM